MRLPSEPLTQHDRSPGPPPRVSSGQKGGWNPAAWAPRRSMPASRCRRAPPYAGRSAKTRRSTGLAHPAVDQPVPRAVGLGVPGPTPACRQARRCAGRPCGSVWASISVWKAARIEAGIGVVAVVDQRRSWPPLHGRLVVARAAALQRTTGLPSSFAGGLAEIGAENMDGGRSEHGQGVGHPVLSRRAPDYSRTPARPLASRRRPGCCRHSSIEDSPEARISASWWPETDEAGLCRHSSASRARRARWSI